MAKTSPRVVSLLPAATEIAVALGANLVGRSHECDFPAGHERIPVVSRPRLDISRPGPEIHASMQALLSRGLAIYEIDLEVLSRLQPDVILTQDQCAVCAVPLSQVEAAARAALAANVTIVSLSPLRLADVREDFFRVGRAIGRDASPLARDFDSALDAVRGLPRISPRPRVLGLEWLDPPMAAGNWFAELLEIAGAIYAVPPTERTERIAWEAIDASRPDVTIVAPCGFSLDRGREELKLLPRPLPGRVCLVDGNAYINRPGPRLADSARIIASASRLQPADPGHWEWVSPAGPSWTSSGSPAPPFRA
ncbi:MAG: ABC transporter substrate-binding protein [Planctomycetes bacterium]|nr:ABC transporter substrate-binding protein [Planctomycetota bacterium]